MTVVSGERTALYLRGVLDLCLLATVGEEHAYGYELTQRLADRGLTVAEGSIYPALARLQREGRLESFTAAGDGGPPRKYYRLTRSGRAALTRWRAEWFALAHAVEDILGGDT
jgi:PadR family transcriptional regulator PadR